MIKDTLYGKYIAQRQNADVIEDEQSFLTYKILKEECFLMDMFVDKEARGSKKFKNLLDSLSVIAKKNGCKFISANIHVSDSGAAHSLTSAFHYGFKLVRADAGILLIILNFNEGA